MRSERLDAGEQTIYLLHVGIIIPRITQLINSLTIARRFLSRLSNTNVLCVAVINYELIESNEWGKKAKRHEEIKLQSSRSQVIKRRERKTSRARSKLLNEGCLDEVSKKGW